MYAGDTISVVSFDHGETPLRALVKSGKLDEPVFAFYLGSGGANGELIIVGVNSAHYTGDFHYVPVVHMPVDCSTVMSR